MRPWEADILLWASKHGFVLTPQDEDRTDEATPEPASQEQSAVAGAGNAGVGLDEVLEVAWGWDWNIRQFASSQRLSLMPHGEA